MIQNAIAEVLKLVQEKSGWKGSDDKRGGVGLFLS